MSKELVKNDDQIAIHAHFKPRARLLLQLGDQLIKNESIALIELVKNSYDADANKATIYIENAEIPQKGIIIIEDDGYGMSAQIVENVWLEPGSDFKSNKIKQLEGSPKYNRLPIGEKGIGRFGVHKLGNVIEMTTKSKDSNEVFVRIDWTDFNDYKYLEDVPITIIERKLPLQFKNGRTGTIISITDLRKKWERGIAREIKRSINALGSPFEVNDSFKPTFEIIDKPEWFKGLLRWEDVKEYALYKFKITLAGNSLKDFEYEFSPWQTMTKLKPKTVTLNDPIVSNFKILKRLEEKVEKIIDLNQYKIGKVVFEGYIFDQDAFILKMGVSDKIGFKKYLKTNGGVKVFRDKLRVYDYGEPETDWLGLDIRRVNQPSKRISNNILLSAISIDRKESGDLIEKTNREGFIENEAYEAFKGAILHCIEIVETIRYTDKLRLREFYGPTPKSAPVMSTLGDAKKYVEENIGEGEVKNKILKYFNKIESDYKTVSENLLKAAGAGLSMSVVVHEVEKIIYEVEKVLKSEKASERALKLVKHLSSLIDGYAEIIRKSSQSTEDIVRVIEQALFNTEYRLNAHQIKVLNNCKSFTGKTSIRLSKNLVIGTIMNLIDNSIYWLDQAGFNAANDNKILSKKIYINLSEDETYLNLIIADNGTGFLIPTDDITEPFVSAKPGGMGLGLHIANEIMESQKGRLIFPELGDFELPEEFEKGVIIVLAFKK